MLAGIDENETTRNMKLAKIKTGRNIFFKIKHFRDRCISTVMRYLYICCVCET